MIQISFPIQFLGWFEGGGHVPLCPIAAWRRVYLQLAYWPGTAADQRSVLSWQLLTSQDIALSWLRDLTSRNTALTWLRHRQRSF